jgi:uncharacterized protein YqfA (UPF0365 family)
MVFLIWLVRFIVYGGLAILALGVIAPAIGGQIGILITAPLAAVALAVDVLVTARLRKTTPTNIVSSRMLLLDDFLSENKTRDEKTTLEIEGQVVDAYKLEDKEEIEKEDKS